MLKLIFKIFSIFKKYDLNCCCTNSNNNNNNNNNCITTTITTATNMNYHYN